MNKYSFHFHTFDALRFISFFLVFLNHIPIPKSSYLSIISHSGGIGVSFFFVLSGFLITYILLNEKTIKGKISLFNFFLRRVLRIWPLFYAMLLFAFITPSILKYFHFTFSNDGYSPNWLLSMLFLENYKMIITKSHPNVSPLWVMWSLCIEEHFYIIWSIIIAFLPSKRIPLLIGVSILIANIARWYFLQCGLPAIDLLTNIDYFAYGAIPAYLLVFKSEIINKVGDIAIYVKYICIAFTIVMIFFLPNVTGKYMSLFSPGILGTLFSTIIVFTLPQKNCLKLRDDLWISKLGLFTYALYLFHTVVINLFKNIKISTFELNWLSISVLSLLVTILLSALSYHFYEKQFLKLKIHFYNN